MLKILIAINYILTSQVAFTQSLATNLLFDQSLLVLKGTVQEIMYVGSDRE